MPQTTQFDPMRNADGLAGQFTFGVEIEMNIPTAFWNAHSITLNSYHSTRYALPSSLRPVRDGLNDSHVISGEWTVQSDVSIHGGRGRGAELVSPVLRGTAGLREVIDVLTRMHEGGCRSNSSCGIHVHIGFGEMFGGRKYDDVYNIIRRLINLVSEHEHALVAIGGNPDRIRAVAGGWAQTIKNDGNLVTHHTGTARKSKLERIGRGIKKSSLIWDGHHRIQRDITPSMKKLRQHAPLGHRVGLNLENLFASKRTVEFRYFRGSTHPIKVVGIIMVALGLCSRAAQTTICRKFNPSVSLPEGKTWADAVDSLHSILNWAYIKDSWAKGAVRYGDATGSDFWNEFGKRILKNQRWNAKRFIQLANRGRSPHHRSARQGTFNLYERITYTS